MRGEEEERKAEEEDGGEARTEYVSMEVSSRMNQHGRLKVGMRQSLARRMPPLCPGCGA